MDNNRAFSKSSAQQHFNESGNCIINLDLRQYYFYQSHHKFGYKLGLKHRQDLGLMDYEPVKNQDLRTFKPSDRQRIIDLYK